MGLRAWLGLEKREDASYTDTLIQLLVNQAAGSTTALPTATAALEASSGLVARSLASASVSGPPWAESALSAPILALIGRSLFRSGEIVFRIVVDGGEVRLVPAAYHDIMGGADPASWEYTLTESGPSGTRTVGPVRGEGVVHLRHSVDVSRPWRGVGPVQSASLAGKLSAGTARLLANEVSGPSGYVLPVPRDGQDPTLDNLREDLKTLNGGTSLVESTQHNWSQGGTAPTREWEPRRIGAKPPETLPAIHKTATMEVLAACGVPPSPRDGRHGGVGRTRGLPKILDHHGRAVGCAHPCRAAPETGRGDRLRLPPASCGGRGEPVAGTQGACRGRGRAGQGSGAGRAVSSGRYRARKAAGLCVSCGQCPADGGCVTCGRCRVRNRANGRRWHRRNPGDSKRRQDARAARGRCRSCGRKPEPEYMTCRRCIEAASLRNRKRREATGRWGAHEITAADKARFRAQAQRKATEKPACQCSRPVPATSSPATRCRRCGRRIA